MTDKDLEFFNDRFDRIEAMMVAVHHRVARLERRYIHELPDVTVDEIESELCVVRLYQEVEDIRGIFRQLQERP